MASLAVPAKVSKKNITEWSASDVLRWIRKYNDKYQLTQEQLEFIEDNPLNGKELLSYKHDTLSEYWKISIDIAKKITQRVVALEVSRRKSEPNINPIDIAKLSNTDNTTNNNNNYVTSYNRHGMLHISFIFNII